MQPQDKHTACTHTGGTALCFAPRAVGCGPFDNERLFALRCHAFLLYALVQRETSDRPECHHHGTRRATKTEATRQSEPGAEATGYSFPTANRWKRSTGRRTSGIQRFRFRRKNRVASAPRSDLQVVQGEPIAGALIGEDVVDRRFNILRFPQVSRASVVSPDGSIMCNELGVAQAARASGLE